MKFYVRLMLLLAMGSSVGHAQQFVEEFDFVGSVTDSSVDPNTFASLDISSVGIVPDIPGFIVENLRVVLTINFANYAISSSGDGLVAGSIISGMSFGGGSIHTDPPGLIFLEGNFTGSNNTFPPTIPGDPPPWPAVIVYDFANGNIPEAMGPFAGINAFEAFGFPSGSATFTIDAHARVTYNVEEADAVRIIDITQGCGTDECMANSVLDTFEVRESSIDNGLPLALADDVEGSVVAFTDGVGDAFPLFPGAQLFLDDEILLIGKASILIAFEDHSLYSYNQGAGVTRLKIIKTESSPVTPSGALSELFPLLVFIFNPSGSVDFDDYINLESEAVFVSVGVYQRSAGPVGSSTQELVRMIDAQSDPFQIGFDYALLDENMTMDVFLDDILVGTFTRESGDPDPSDFTHAVIDIDEENGLMLGPVELRFRVTAPVGTGFLIDNVTGPGFTDPGFDFGFGPWFARGDGGMAMAGVVYNELCLGSGDFDRGDLLSVPSDPLDVVKGDVNLDGKPDIAVLTGDLFGAGGATTITVMLGDGEGGFTNATDYPLEAPVIRIALHDVTGDIYPDIVFISQSGNEPSPTSYNDGINLMVNDGASGFGSPTTISQNPSDQQFVNSFTIADVNNDQILDIPYFTGDGIEFRVLIGDGSGGFSEPVSGLFLDFQSADAMIPGDFDEDGDLDVIVGYRGENVELLSNDGNGVFSRGPVFATNPDVRQIIASDFNGDGHLDLAVRHFFQHPDAIHIFHGDGMGGFVPTQQLVNSISALNRITQMQAGDIDNDGDRDLVVMTNGFNTLTRLVNNGSGSFTEEAVSGDGTPLFASGQGFVLIDTNRDGSLDIVGDDGFSQTVGVYTGVCAPLCPADFTGDGALNFFDVSAFLIAFNTMDPAGDFTGDGAFNFFDVSAFLIAFNAGCP